MVRKKIDNRIRLLIENGVNLGHRTIFVIVGDKGRDQVNLKKREIAFTGFILFLLFFLDSDFTSYAREDDG